MEWIVILTIFTVVCIICLLKFLITAFQYWEQICNCYIVRGHRRDDTEELISGRNSPPDMHDIARSRTRYMRTQPPPDFDTALRNSVPISYIDVEDEPPPSYDDFLKSFSSQIDIESSINPCSGIVLDDTAARNSTSEA